MPAGAETRGTIRAPPEPFPPVSPGRMVCRLCPLLPGDGGRAATPPSRGAASPPERSEVRGTARVGKLRGDAGGRVLLGRGILGTGGTHGSRLLRVTAQGHRSQVFPVPPARVLRCGTLPRLFALALHLKINASCGSCSAFMVQIVSAPLCGCCRLSQERHRAARICGRARTAPLCRIMVGLPSRWLADREAKQQAWDKSAASTRAKFKLIGRFLEPVLSRSSDPFDVPRGSSRPPFLPPLSFARPGLPSVHGATSGPSAVAEKRAQGRIPASAPEEQRGKRVSTR